MSWVKIDDSFATHPKVAGISDGAFRLYMAALCYSARHQTDGYLAIILLSTIGVRRSKERSKELVEVGLWEVVEGGYIIHDYLEYNPSKADQLRSKQARSVAGKRGARARWEA